MKQAIEHLDLDKIKILIDQIQKQNRELAKAIQEKIDKFEYVMEACQLRKFGEEHTFWSYG